MCYVLCYIVLDEILGNLLSEENSASLLSSLSIIFYSVGCSGIFARFSACIYPFLLGEIFLYL